jgi:glycosyltransferase involved in cell wall biosynthesis
VARVVSRRSVKVVASPLDPTGDTPGKSPLRILIASHSHPQLSKGGAEISAFQLFQELQRQPQCETWFLGCDRRETNPKLGARISQPFSDREYIYSVGAYDWFKFANRDAGFPQDFRHLLERLRPRVVHFHHYLGFGVEAFLHVRETLPDAKIVLTLHEYLALCHHFGQMITNPDRSLCYDSKPERCAECFESIPISDFFLRRLYIERFFNLVDQFIAPSEFLAERYVAWGVPKDRMTVIENVIPAPLHQPRAAAPLDRPPLLRVGFFGQISFLKGINVLLEAAEILLDRKVNGIVFEIYGDYRGQPTEFQSDFLARLAKAGRNVKFNGPYEQHRVDLLMRSVDAVLMPSIWWENSPVVIQEALRNRRPVVCSDIGGMAEKIRDGVDGFHFPVGNSAALSSLLLRLAKSPAKLMALRSTMRCPGTTRDIIARHWELYSELLPGA